MTISSAQPTVYVVHCVDTEGPLAESLTATFERLNAIFGINLPATPATLAALQSDKVSCGVDPHALRKLLDPHLLSYKRNWQELNAMLATITSPEFRTKTHDADGRGWRYNWFCVDHVGYVANPRERDLGHHRIFDRYMQLVSLPENSTDQVYFHYHPLPFNQMAHACATSYFNGNHLYEILARKVIERSWFPTLFRPGFHTTRPDSNWFLEQWLPFDYANQATDVQVDQPDLASGRFGDWRRAPKIWGAYHPSHDDYQTPGNCRRWIFRCLNMQARLRQLEPADVTSAFAQAVHEGSAVLAFTNHDFRDMVSEIDTVRGMIHDIACSWPDVRIEYSSALHAARCHLNLDGSRQLGLEMSWATAGGSGNRELTVTCDRPLFGPQPFLAIEDQAGNFYHDNFDFTMSPTEWRYRFDWQTFPPEQLQAVGVAATGAAGEVEVAVWRRDSDEHLLTRWDIA